MALRICSKYVYVFHNDGSPDGLNMNPVDPAETAEERGEWLDCRLCVLQSQWKVRLDIVVTSS